jgi:hypothetical protein
MHYAAREGVELGGLVSYGVNLPDLSRATAIYLARILKGAKPAEFGVHMCVGQLLARLEGEVLLGALARKVEAIEMSGEPRRRYNNTLRGLESRRMPMRLDTSFCVSFQAIRTSTKAFTIRWISETSATRRR